MIGLSGFCNLVPPVVPKYDWIYSKRPFMYSIRKLNIPKLNLLLVFGINPLAYHNNSCGQSTPAAVSGNVGPQWVSIGIFPKFPSEMNCRLIERRFDYVCIHSNR